MTLPIISRVNFGSSLLIEIEVRGASRGHRPYWMVTRNSAIRSILDIVQFSGQSHCQCLIWLHCRHGLHSPYLGTVSNGLACGVCMAVAWRVGAVPFLSAEWPGVGFAFSSHTLTLGLYFLLFMTPIGINRVVIKRSLQTQG